MIKLLKKIRQKLLGENKLRNYLLYAVGEIVLIVIGILIAVQINNKNTERQRKVLEIKILNEILNNLSDDLVQIKDEIFSDSVIIHADSLLISHIRLSASFNDTFAGYLRVAEMFPHFDSKESGFQLLESKGIDLITDDSLRIKITDFYKREYPYFRKYERERVEIIQTIIKPYWTEHFYLESYSSWPYLKRTPIKNEETMRDEELISLLQTSSSLSNIMLEKAYFIERQAEQLQKQIVQYLADKN
ncbi:MAG: DUF6090 family protein [Chitinophagales bacterium]